MYLALKKSMLTHPCVEVLYEKGSMALEHQESGQIAIPGGT